MEIYSREIVKEDSIIDATNIVSGTYFPSATGLLYGDFTDLSLTGKLIDGAGETTSLTVEGTNDEDNNNADWIQVYGFDCKNNAVINTVSATNETKTFAWDFDKFNYKFLRFLITTTAPTNTVILKIRRRF